MPRTSCQILLYQPPRFLRPIGESARNVCHADNRRIAKFDLIPRKTKGQQGRFLVHLVLVSLVSLRSLGSLVFQLL